VSLLAACHRRGIPVLCVAGAGAKADPSRLRIADVSESNVDPLARAVSHSVTNCSVTPRCMRPLPCMHGEQQKLDKVKTFTPKHHAVEVFAAAVAVANRCTSPNRGVPAVAARVSSVTNAGSTRARVGTGATLPTL